MISDKIVRAARFQCERALTAANFRRAMSLKGEPVELKPPFTEVLFDVRRGAPRLFVIHSAPRVLITAETYAQLVFTGQLAEVYVTQPATRKHHHESV